MTTVVDDVYVMVRGVDGQTFYPRTIKVCKSLTFGRVGLTTLIIELFIYLFTKTSAYVIGRFISFCFDLSIFELVLRSISCERKNE